MNEFEIRGKDNAFLTKEQAEEAVRRCKEYNELKTENKQLKEALGQTTKCDKIVDWLQEAETSSLMAELDDAIGFVCPTGLLEVAVACADQALKENEMWRMKEVKTKYLPLRTRLRWAWAIIRGKIVAENVPIKDKES